MKKCSVDLCQAATLQCEGRFRLVLFLRYPLCRRPLRHLKGHGLEGEEGDGAGEEQIESGTEGDGLRPTG